MSGNFSYEYWERGGEACENPPKALKDPPAVIYAGDASSVKTEGEARGFRYAEFLGQAEVGEPSAEEPLAGEAAVGEHSVEEPSAGEPEGEYPSGGIPRAWGLNGEAGLGWGRGEAGAREGARKGRRESLRRDEASRKIEKGFKRLLLVGFIAVCAYAVWFFVITPLIPFSRVEIRSFDGFDPAAVLAAAGVGESASFFSLNAAQAQGRLSAHPLVEQAVVIKHFPNRLSIFLEPRRPVAVSFENVGGRHLPLFIDRHGVVVSVGGHLFPASMPVISGLAFHNPAAGMRMPHAFLPLLEDISRISDNSPELLAAISEIRLNRTTGYDFDLILYPAHSFIRVRVDRRLSEDTLRHMLLMLDIFETRFPQPAEIDFRSGVGSYRI